MAAAATQKPRQRQDIATLILRALRQMGLPALPRNYDLLYETYTGTDAELTSTVAALGSNVTQDEFDRIAKKHLGGRQENQIVDRAHSRLSMQLEEVLALLRKEQLSLESYGRLLGETYGRISMKSLASAELLASAIQALAEATGDTMAEGREIAASVGARSNEVAALKHELDEYKRIANTDSLTRLGNRRAFDETIGQIYSPPPQAAFHALLLVDIDNFKSLNDTFGHPVGDRVLAIIASVIRGTVRHDAFVARTGGEEFAIILRDVTTGDAIAMADGVRAAVAATPLRNSRTSTDYGPVTVSIGVCMGNQAPNADELYRRVDVALYVAKTSGRNRTEIYSEALEAGSLSARFLYRRTIG
ncbi:MAG: GGDEF domain-containing protein [Pararhizobium sp.]